MTSPTNETSSHIIGNTSPPHSVTALADYEVGDGQHLDTTATSSPRSMTFDHNGDDTSLPYSGITPATHEVENLRKTPDMASSAWIPASNHSSLPTSTTMTANDTAENMLSQDASPLFRLPPELRNLIYTYAIDRKGEHCGRDGWNDCPTISLYDASRFAPSDKLLTTCRRVYLESKDMPRSYWRECTFTLQLIPCSRWRSCQNLVRFLDDKHFNRMARITIDVTSRQQPETFKIHFTNSKWPSVVPRPATAQEICTHELRFNHDAVKENISLIRETLHESLPEDEILIHTCDACGQVSSIDPRIRGEWNINKFDRIVTWVCEEFDVDLTPG